MSLETHTGSCHCGAIRFEADIDLDEGSNRCNCSYCAKVRVWFAFARGAERYLWRPHLRARRARVAGRHLPRRVRADARSLA